MRSTRIRSLAALAVFAVALAFMATRAYRSPAIETMGRSASDICGELLTAADVIRACPIAATREGLRVRTDSEAFSKLSKCGLSVTARGGYTFYIAVNVFRDAASAIARFRQQTKNVVNGLAIAPGNEFGFGEASALHHAYGGPELDIQRDHVYIEMTPSGGILCSDEDLRTLGRLLYERASRFPPHTGRALRSFGR